MVLLCTSVLDYLRMEEHYYNPNQSKNSMRLTHSQCMTVCMCALVEQSMSVFRCVKMWSIWVCVSLLGSHWTDPGPLLKTKTALFYVRPASESVPMKLAPFFGLFKIACTLNGFCGGWQGPVGADLKTKRDWQVQSWHTTPEVPLNHITHSYSRFLVKAN